MADVLLEIGTEEIPARFVGKLLTELKSTITRELVARRLSAESIETFGTDRRVVLLIKNLLEKQPDVAKELKGPPAELAFQDNILTPAGLGFCKKNNLDPTKIQKKDFNGKAYLFAKVQEKGQKTKILLPEIYRKILTELHLPIAMRWGNLDIEFIRPIHWLVSLYDDHILKFEFAGIKAKNKSRGHRFLSNKELAITAPNKYFAVLEKNHVYADQNLRRDMILAQVKQIEKEKGLKALVPEDLLWEVTYINECPKAVLAEIDEKYLMVPQECLITTMQKNQKYFPLVNKQGRLSKYFILVANNVNKKSLPNIVKGNVKVVAARLEDAKFFYEEDLKVKLDTMTEGLKHVTYQEKIGTIYEKIERVTKITEWLSVQLNLSDIEKKQIARTARICKADLNSKMVYEFPELQGVMGAYYAAAVGEDKAVAEAVRDHWKPRYSGEDISKMSKVSAVVSIADKIDSICACFCAGLIPSSSSDPYALRRAAQGIANIIINQKINQFTLKELIETSVKLVKSESYDNTVKDIEQFFISRKKYIMQELGISYDVINAVINAKRVGQSAFTLIREIELGLVLNKIKTQLKSVYETAVRLTNILKGVEVDIQGLKHELMQPVEQDLNKKLGEVSLEINNLLLNNEYEKAFNCLFPLNTLIDKFFKDILVNDDNLEIRKNRQILVKRLLNTYNLFVNLTELVYSA